MIKTQENITVSSKKIDNPYFLCENCSSFKDCHEKPRKSCPMFVLAVKPLDSFFSDNKRQSLK